jgi:O-methyltransferase involved in polyketide biosynthesis
VAAPGSELVFTYIDQRAFEGPALERFETVRTRLAAAGEPWLSGFHPAKLPEELATIGLELIEDLDGVALGQRLSGETAGLYAGVLGHIAHVRVPNRP